MIRSVKISFVGIGLLGPNRQHRVEHQHPLASPTLQAAVARRLNAQIVPQLLIDVNQRRRDPLALLHRKAQAMGLPRPMIRVLPARTWL